MKFLVLLLSTISFSNAFLSIAQAKPGSVDINELNTIIDENVKQESGLRKTIQDSSGFQEDKITETPAFKPDKKTREDLTDNVAVSTPSNKLINRGKEKKKKHLKLEDPSGERISQEFNETDL